MLCIKVAQDPRLLLAQWRGRHLNNCSLKQLILQLKCAQNAKETEEWMTIWGWWGSLKLLPKIMIF